MPAEKKSLSETVGAGYGDFWHDKSRYRVLKGGKGSKKSTTTALNLIYRIMKYPYSNLLVVRQVMNTHRDSTFAQLKWAQAKLGVSHLWRNNVSPMEMTYIPTGQKILFRGFDDVLKLATLYLRIFFFAMPFIEIYDFGSAVLRSKGDSARPLYALITAGVINVILNLVFVIVFKMGAAGVATATVISNFFSACMILYFLTHEEEMLRLDFRKLRIRWEYLLGIIKIGLPAGLQSMVFSLSNVVIQAAINSFGSDGIAGSTAEQNFEFMAYFVINAFAQTATTFTSQNFAAQDKERCKKIYRLCTFIGLASCLGLSLIFLIGRHLFIQIFSTDENVIHYAMIRMWSVCLLELLTGVYEISGGCLRGMGHSMTPAVITVLGTCVFRLVWVNTIYAAHRSYLMLMIVYPVSWVITGTAVTVAYFIIRRKEFAQIGKRRADII